MSAARSGVRPLEDLDLRLGLHLLDGVGGGLIVEGGQDAGPVARRELVDDRGQVGRMELGQADVGHAQLDRGDARLDRVHVLPVDVALRGRQAQVPGDDPVRALDAEPTEQAGRPDVDGHETELVLDVVQAQVVDPDDLASIDVHDLLVEQVLAQLDLVGALLELGDVDRVVRRRAPDASKRATLDQGRKMRRLSVATTRPVTGG